ncbi:hypothetical protein BABINDRAFT_161967 [Babjeviella inositovora NRRL Y-12698]|uniref:Uncharacterized protein n=1 Tax=Babjeviella inositovora NRRL Y-12698 TaxID=984486 RepID=A0A1E3QPF6_9ASCO|nr:uncharacterized protein BABINDRAFT_161967 [Babjeviella inositovora NRRL Y-12698]ODQ79583.1 hypothetical protein BABINDRAFT_161967 [Babjeviella inositovora NRRL Y-12698]
MPADYTTPDGFITDINRQLSEFDQTPELFRRLVDFNIQLLQFSSTLPPPAEGGSVQLPETIKSQLQYFQKLLLLETAGLQNSHRRTKDALLRSSPVRILDSVAKTRSEEETRLIALYQQYLDEIQEYQELIFRNNEVQTELDRSDKSTAKLRAEVSFEFSKEVFEIIRSQIADGTSDISAEALDMDAKRVDIHQLSYSQFVDHIARYEQRFRTKQGVIHDYLLTTRKRLKVSNDKWVASYNELSKISKKIDDKFKAVKRERGVIDREKNFDESLYAYYDEGEENEEEEDNADEYREGEEANAEGELDDNVGDLNGDGGFTDNGDLNDEGDLNDSEGDFNNIEGEEQTNADEEYPNHEQAENYELYDETVSGSREGTVGTENTPNDEEMTDAGGLSGSVSEKE